MSPGRLFLTTLAGWLAVVTSAFVTRVALANTGISMPEYAGWFFLASAPAITAFLVLRGRSSTSIAEVLYDAEHAGERAGRR